jgi:hypothetical protein
MVGSVAETIVSRLQRSGLVARLSWSDALAWFSHQDQGLHHDPVRALVRLSVQAQGTDPRVRQEVDDLLVTALLADLRISMAEARGRPCNALVLLDHADAPGAVAFVAALNRVRRDLASSGSRTPPDPLAVVAASGGELVAELSGAQSQPSALAESAVTGLNGEKVRRAGTLLVVGIEDLTVQDVRSLTKAREWPASLALTAVADSVYGLTGGHPGAATLVLDELENDPRHLERLDGALRLPGPSGGATVADHLLDRFVAGLSPHRRVDRLLRNWLVTLSAARDQEEAKQLDVLLEAPTATGRLVGSRTLWSHTGQRGGPALVPFVRYLGLRALAAREADDPASWPAVFETLRTNATDLAGRLHHELALGGLDTVAHQLTELLPATSAADWFALVDQAVITPGLAPTAAADPNAVAGDRAAVVARLVAALRQVADPGAWTGDESREQLALIAVDCRSLAQFARSPEDQVDFILRARHYEAQSNTLS